MSGIQDLFKVSARLQRSDSHPKPASRKPAARETAGELSFFPAHWHCRTEHRSARANYRDLRQAERGADIAPGLHPGHAALFELGENLAGNRLVETVVVGEGFMSGPGGGMGRSPRRAGESSLSPGAPVARSSLFLSLAGDPALSRSSR
jgi:hypothetical protein